MIEQIRRRKPKAKTKAKVKVKVQVKVKTCTRTLATPITLVSLTAFILSFLSLFSLLSLLSLFSLLSLLAPAPCLAQSSLEDLIVGDFSIDDDESLDPLAAIFSRKTSDGVDGISTAHDLPHDLAERSLLGKFFGLHQEGENLSLFCQSDRHLPLTYPSLKEHQKVLRSVLSTLQYIGLEVTISALPRYAHYFDFSPEDYGHLTTNLTQNFCSTNLSVIGRQKLTQQMVTLFEKSRFELPSTRSNLLFPQNLDELIPEDEFRRREFFYTIKLFQSFCSWGGETDNLRLLVPFVQHPSLMAMIFRQLTGKTLYWQPAFNSVAIRPSAHSVQVDCQGLICRRVSPKQFDTLWVEAIGSKGRRDDLDRLYCQELRPARYQKKNQVPEIAAIIDQRTLNPRDDRLMIGQFLALMTGVPNFLLRRPEGPQGLSQVLRSSVTSFWDNWAKKNLERLQSFLSYEDSLSLELVDRARYFNYRLPSFSVVFDINAGEFDRINQMQGKISTTMNLSLHHRFLRWIRDEWTILKPQNTARRMLLITTLRRRLGKDVLSMAEGLGKKKWHKKLETLIIDELLAQLERYQGPFFHSPKNQLVKIPITFNYAPFALKSIHNNWLQKREIKKSQAFLK